jgi:manganese/iron transport system ATP-binding protein
VLQHVGIVGKTLHNDNDDREITILSDHEKPAVFYGSKQNQPKIITDKNKEEDHVC